MSSSSYDQNKVTTGSHVKSDPERYTVTVDDNFHYQDKDHRYDLGDFDSLDVAISRCKELVDEYLDSAKTPEITETELYASYTHFGPDPYIVPAGPSVFSAWGYAKERCRQLCSDAAKP